MIDQIPDSIESVFVLSSGSYSDYRVHCVVRGTRADAERLAERASRDNDYDDTYGVEEMSVVSSDLERVDVISFTAEIRDDGHNPRVAEERGPYHRIEWPFDALYGTPAVYWRWVRAPAHQGRGGRLDVHGVDHERVRKVFSDRKAQLLTDDAMRARTEMDGSR